MGIWLSHIQWSIVELFVTQVTLQDLQTGSRKREEEAGVERRLSCLYQEKCSCNCRFWHRNHNVASETLLLKQLHLFPGPSFPNDCYSVVNSGGTGAKQVTLILKVRNIHNQLKRGLKMLRSIVFPVAGLPKCLCSPGNVSWQTMLCSHGFWYSLRLTVHY